MQPALCPICCRIPVGGRMGVFGRSGLCALFRAGLGMRSVARRGRLSRNRCGEEGTAYEFLPVVRNSGQVIAEGRKDAFKPVYGEVAAIQEREANGLAINACAARQLTLRNAPFGLQLSDNLRPFFHWTMPSRMILVVPNERRTVVKRSAVSTGSCSSSFAPPKIAFSMATRPL